MRRIVVLVGAVFVAVMSFAAAALGAAPTDRVYGGEGGNVVQDVSGEVAGGSTLPFTGLDLLVMVVAAALLVGAGLTIRRMARAKA